MDTSNNPTTKAGAAVHRLEAIMEVHLKEECTISNNRRWDTIKASVDTVRRQEEEFVLGFWERWRVAAVSIC